MSMPTDLSLGDILHISLGENVKCFGLTKISGDTKPCSHRLGKGKLAEARLILGLTLGQIERAGQTIDQNLINLSNLLVHSLRHGVAGETRRESLRSGWQETIQDFRRAQNHLEPEIEISYQSEDDELDDAAEDEDLQEGPGPVLAIESDTATSIVAARSTNTELDTTPDSTPLPDLPAQVTESQVQISQHRTSNVLRPVPESFGDRTSLTPACVSVTHRSISSHDVSVSPEYVWFLLLQFCFGLRALMHLKFNTVCSIDGFGRLWRRSFADLQFPFRTRFFSNSLTQALVFMIPFCYGLYGLLQVLLRSYVLMVL
jgi:hypothetical protein